MGSGESRNDKDEVIVRRPKKIVESLSAGVGAGAADVAADVCTPSFKVKVKMTPHLKEGVPVRLAKREESYIVLHSTTEIGKLNATQAAMVDRCSQLGVNYSGKILIHDEQPYAVFKRKL